MKTIVVVEEFYPRPKWRYRSEGDGSGEAFREELLAPALRDNNEVKVDLTGYNRYGPSFVSEAFGGLIRNEGFSFEELEKKLKIVHERLPSFVGVCWEEIGKAHRESIK
ncbi:STAS-like domain-containing protein [Vibrio alginolyticus]|uniref:STAS-like domain-containing protein n=1 Tax=Vibrio alginolyticus TaxID=663 RepID=UPI0022DE1788|nr:STAS-like domain-containing protein [Vibrio alginolyticus]MDA0420645.1 STAS-like domain-containing protein [Vibrio alginolyticus]